jgi:heat shock protein HslJ
MMGMRTGGLGAALLALAACQPAPKQDQKPEATIEPTPQRELAGVAGQWLLVDAAGRPVSGVPDGGLTLRAGRKHILMQSQCIYFYWTYETKPDGGFAAKTANWPFKSPDESSIPRPMCARGLLPEEQRVSSAISNASQYRLTTPDTLVFTSGETQIQFKRRPNIEGAWQVESVNGTRPGPRDYQFEISAQKGEMRGTSQCVYWAWRYRLDTQRASFQPKPIVEASCERSITSFEKSVVDMIDQARVWTFDADRNLRLAGSKGQIVLAPLGSE